MFRRLASLGVLLALTASAPALAQDCDYSHLQPNTAVSRLLRTFREAQELAPKMELVYGLSNDHRGIISRYDARRILQSALSAILESDDPQATFENNMKYFEAARAALGTDERAKKLLAKYPAAGQRAVYERDRMLNPSELPLEVRKRFFTMLSWQLDALDNVPASKLEIDDVDELSADVYEFDYHFTGVTGDGTKGKAFARRYHGQWIFTPVKVSEADLDQVAADLRSHYKEFFIPYFDRNDPNYDDNVRDALSALGPDNTVWEGGYGDPYGFTSDYPVVFETGDPAGSDNAFYTGIDPETGAIETYDFN